MKHTSWQYLAAIINRLHGKEVNITEEDLEAVRNHVIESYYDNGKVKLTIGIPVAFPDEINADMANGYDEAS